ncbi:cytochrome P450 [Chlamydoabsidia padenii]|nr:cytochrome P450 [Chlamydoabsidia padenii]
MITSILNGVMTNDKLKGQYAVTSLIAAIITMSIILHKRRDDDDIPTVPYVMPVLGSTLDNNRDKLKFAKETAEKYGPVYRAHLYGKIVTIVGAGHAEEVFRHPDMSFHVSQRKKFDMTLFFDSYPFELPKSSVIDSIVRELNPRLKHYSPRAYMEFEKVMAAMLGEKESVVLSNLSPVIVSCISHSCLSVFLGTSASQDASLTTTFTKMFQDLSDEFSLSIWHQVFPWFHQTYMRWYYPSMGSMKKHRSTIKEVIEKELDRRLSNEIQVDDLLQYVLKMHPMKNDDVTIESLTSYIQIMFFVGVLTTVGSTIAIINIIAKDASIIKALREEQEKALNDEIETQGLGDTTAIDRNAFLIKNVTHIYKRLAKLDSLIREFFRYGVRELGHSHTNVGTENIVLKSGAIIRPGEEVFINLWDVHQQTEEETDQMDEFHPFRYVGRQTSSTKVGKDFMLFGVGKHACPGRWFAIHQIKGIITCLIRNYEMTSLESGSVRFQKLSMNQ